MTPTVGVAARRAVLAVVLVAQTAIFVVSLQRPLRVEADNARYETAGYNLARGDGLSLPYDLQPDPDVQQWACSRHPSRCTDGNVPTAMYPPGYQFYIASIYLATGRQLWALLVSHLVLLWSMFWVLERLAAQYLDRAGYFFVLGLAATYPFLAHQAAYVMSDHLHSALVMFALAVPLLRPAGWGRGVACGLLLGVATLTRPYSFVCLPFVAWALARNSDDPKWRVDLAGLVLGIALPFAIWIARNEIVFGRLIPFGTAGLGISLYYNKLAWTIGSPYDASNARASMEEVVRVAGADPLTWHANRVLTAAALDWMRQHPWKVMGSLPLRVVRLWISMGTSGQGVSRAWPLLVTYLGGLLALGVAGMWRGRRRREILLMTLFVLPYWAFLLHTPPEARRTLALRLPMLLCAGVAVDAIVASRLGQQGRTWLAIFKVRGAAESPRNPGA